MTDQQRSAIRAACLDGPCLSCGCTPEDCLGEGCDEPGCPCSRVPLPAGASRPVPVTPEQRAEWRRYVRSLATGQDAQWEGEASGQ